MEKNNNKPKLRFPEFTDPWEQHKFRDMYEKVSEKNDLSYGTNKIISVANMYFKSDVNISDKEYLRTYNIFKLGDIAFEGNKSKDFAHGRFVENSIGDGIVSHVFDVFRPVMEFDLQFWKYAINNERLMRNVLIRCTKSSTMMTNLVANDFLEESFQVPCLEEQKKIGAYFKSFDNFITLHQCKLNHLQDKKKSLLQKMFPKSGEVFPELRFPGFTGPWEQRKLGEVFNQTTEYVNPQAESIELWSLTVKNGLTPKIDRYVRDFLVKKENKYKAVRPNDIVYNPMNMTLGAIGYNNMSKIVAVSGYYVTMKPTDLIEGYYIKTWMQRYDSINLYKMCATGSLIEKQRVQYPTFAEINFTLPEIEEQKKIGAYFRNIDNLIIIHQRKLNHLQEQKKVLLQQMFV